jgi:hypothetical protein
MKIDSVKTVSTKLAGHLPVEFERVHRDIRAEKSFETMDVPPSTERILYNQLESANADTLVLAQKIRSIDTTIQHVERNVHQMNQLLDGIVKSFPPFPIDSDERIQTLRQFSSLRKMIDQLTFPPPDKSPNMILGDSAAYPHAGSWEMATAGGETVKLGHLPLHTGPAGLDIPEVAPDASGEQIRIVLEKTTAAQGIIDRRRRAFVADANRLIAFLS